MKTQLTIIGLGQIGTSVGMALNKYKDQIIRIGHDKHRVIGNRAKDLDAVDKITLTLSGSVKDADIVLIALPFHEIYPVLEHISQDLKHYNSKQHTVEKTTTTHQEKNPKKSYSNS